MSTNRRESERETGSGDYRLLRQLVLSEGHQRYGKTRHCVAGEEVPCPKELRIVQYPDEAGFYLFYCYPSGHEVTDTYHDSLEAALSQAKFEFDTKPEEWTVVEQAYTGAPDDTDGSRTTHPSFYSTPGTWLGLAIGATLAWLEWLWWDATVGESRRVSWVPPRQNQGWEYSWAADYAFIALGFTVVVLCAFSGALLGRRKLTPST